MVQLEVYLVKKLENESFLEGKRVLVIKCLQRLGCFDKVFCEENILVTLMRCHECQILSEVRILSYHEFIEELEASLVVVLPSEKLGTWKEQERDLVPRLVQVNGPHEETIVLVKEYLTNFVLFANF